MIADLLREELEDAGAEVIGPAPGVAAALALIESETAIGGAILDVSLGGEMAWSVADALLARGVPVVFTTGYDAAIIPARYAGINRCEKPATLQDIVKKLAG